MKYSFYVCCALLGIGGMVHAYNVEQHYTQVMAEADRTCVNAIIQMDQWWHFRTTPKKVQPNEM